MFFIYLRNLHNGNHVFFVFPLRFNVGGFLFGGMGIKCIFTETKQYAMHKDKRKKRLGRKQKRINKNRDWWAWTMERNKEWLNQPMPQMLCRDYLGKNRTALHNEEFINIVCKKWHIPSQEISTI